MAKKGHEKPINRYPIEYTDEHRSKLNRAIAWPNTMTANTRNSIITKIKDQYKREKFNAGDQCWGPLPGLGHKTMATRYEVMEYLVGCMEMSGMSLEELLASHEQEVNEYGAAFPTLAEVRRWEKFHPEFAKAMKFAEEIRGEILTEAAVRTVLDSPETRDPRRIKLEYDALKNHGAILNPKFKDKQVIQTEDITDNMTREQLLAQIKAMADKHKEIKEVIEGEVIQDAAESNLGDGD